MTNVLAIVLTGGLGTRVRRLLAGLPKPLAPVNGRPFLEWVLRFLYAQGFRRIVLSAGYHAGKVESFAAGIGIPGLSLSCVSEREPLGTAGGLLHALRGSGDAGSDVLVCNGDSLVLTDLAPMLQMLDDRATVGALLSVRVPDAARFGSVRVDGDGSLSGFIEKQAGAGQINGGVYLFRRGVIGEFPGHRPLSFEHDVFPALLARGARIAVRVCDAPFIDIGTEDSLAQADAFVHAHARWFS